MCQEVALVVKKPPCQRRRHEMWAGSLGGEDALEEEGMATHSSLLAWEVPGQRSLVGCSLRVRRVRTTEVT